MNKAMDWLQNNRLWAVYLPMIVLAMGAATYQPTINTEQIDSIVMAYEAVEWADEWEEEVAERHDHALVVISHGLSFDEPLDQWYITPHWGDAVPVEQYISYLRQFHPERRIVLVMCNPAGYELEGVENVTYALNNVWVVPDDDTPEQDATIRDAIDPDTVGDISEFVES